MSCLVECDIDYAVDIGVIIYVDNSVNEDMLVLFLLSTITKKNSFTSLL